MRYGLLLVLLVVALVLEGGGCTVEGAAPDGGRKLTVAAAADLYFAFDEIGDAFEGETGSEVVFMFGSTGSLASQIEHGAPVDVFAAADVQRVERLRAKGFLIADTARVYALGRIVLVVSRKAGVRATTLAQLLRPEVKRIAIANPAHAPYGVAARQALVSAGLWEQLQPKLVYGETVRQALQFVQTGNAEAAIVALAIADVPEVTYTPIDQELHEPIRQAIAVVRATRQEKLAREFVDFVSGPKGRAILKKYGFLMPGEY